VVADAALHGHRSTPAAFAEAALTLEDTYTFPRIQHYSMEPHTAIAQVDTDGINIWTSTGHPFGVRQEVAEIFHFPLSKIRVHVNFVGGAYGSKSGGKIEPLVVALARKALEAADQTAALSRQRRETGVSAALEDVQAEDELARARRDYLGTVADYNQAQYALQFATGN